MERETTNKYVVLGEDRQRDELACWLNGYDWQYFVTLTYRFRSDGDREFKSWTKRLVSLTGAPLSFAMVTERSTAGCVHHHALVASVGVLSVTRLREAWSHGISEAQAYEPGRGAAHYLAKSYGRNSLVAWDISDEMPPFRRAGEVST